MAQRLALRWLLSLTPRTLPSQGPLALHASLAAHGRAFSTSAGCRSTFNVQDGSDFQDRVVNNPKPVVVDFHAQWCGPCKILGPRLEKMVAKQEGKVLMAKVDIDDHTDLAIEYEVSAVPTVLAMKNGDVVDKFVGIKDEDQLEAFLKKLIGA
ncbi:thioredoxin, mitochondrial [Podargus strigoides]